MSPIESLWEFSLEVQSDATKDKKWIFVLHNTLNHVMFHALNLTFHELPWSCLLAHFTFSERGQLAKKKTTPVYVLY